MENRLRELRTQRGLSQRQAAELTGIHYNTYMAIENGRSCHYDVIMALADLFEVSMDYILMRSDVPGVAKPDNDNLKNLLTKKFGSEVIGIAEAILALDLHKGGDKS